MQYALAKIPTPVLNTPKFSEVFGGEDGTTLPLDSQGLLRPVEMIALPGTKFALLERVTSNIYKAQTQEYPGATLYVDIRFLQRASKNAPQRLRKMPGKEAILNTLKSLEKTAYVWGGNWLGIPEMLVYYPPNRKISSALASHWTLNGVGCSGLLYLATQGSTPRNTSDLVHFGKSLPIQKKSVKEIQKLVRALDIIVWKGHVLIVLDKDTLIESHADKMQVLKTPLFSSAGRDRLANEAHARKRLE